MRNLKKLSLLIWIGFILELFQEAKCSKEAFSPRMFLQLSKPPDHSIEVEFNPLTPSMVTGYNLYYKDDIEDWQKIYIAPSAPPKYEFSDLRCGVYYYFKLTVLYEKFGESEPSNIIQARKPRAKPEAPSQEDFIEVHMTAATLHLDSWNDGGCSVDNFFVEYKLKNEERWTLASNQVRPIGNYVIMELTPATWYDVRVTGHNNAGSTEAVYTFVTMTRYGSFPDPVPEMEESSDEHKELLQFFQEKFDEFQQKFGNFQEKFEELSRKIDDVVEHCVV